MSMRGAIETRISEFLAADDPKLEWVKPAARKHAFLPLYVGWVAVLGVHRTAPSFGVLGTQYAIRCQLGRHPQAAWGGLGARCDNREGGTNFAVQALRVGMDLRMVSPCPLASIPRGWCHDRRSRG
jgi:hypothetical protein